jgi:integrase
MAFIVKTASGKWAMDFFDAARKRHRVTYDSWREANEANTDHERQKRQSRRLTVDFNVSFEDYARKVWLPRIEARVKPRTFVSYKATLDLHILPDIGKAKVRQFSTGDILDFLSGKVKARKPGKKEGDPDRPKFSRNSVRIMYATLRAMLQSAKVHDGLLLANPAEKLGRELRLTSAAKVREAEVKAMDHGQVDAFLTAAEEEAPRYAPLFLLLARSGMRIGEALALKWQDVDLDRREITVERTLSTAEEGQDGQPATGTTKGGRSRRVDASKQLCAALRRLEVQRKAETLQEGLGKVREWVFCSESGQPMDPSKVGKEFRKVLDKAVLKGRFSVHSLRHSYASRLLQLGQSPAYVQRQLGHASIQLTVDTYGRWLPMENKAAVDLLDMAPDAAKSAGVKGL